MCHVLHLIATSDVLCDGCVAAWIRCAGVANDSDNTACGDTDARCRPWSNRITGVEVSIIQCTTCVMYEEEE